MKNIGDPIGEALILGFYRAVKELRRARGTFDTANEKLQQAAAALDTAKERHARLRTYLTEVNFLTIAEEVTQQFDEIDEPEAAIVQEYLAMKQQEEKESDG